MKDRLNHIPVPLLNWYVKTARVLPFREEPTPYRIWVSEIMLQQTRVEAALPYFERFVKTLPNIESLAAAEEGVLLKLWEGLGYYSRVRNLQKAAKIVMEKHGGELPADFDALLKLPGIGEYTAGAISSIAFGLQHPAVDGNVLRVFARIFADNRNIALPEVKKEYGSEITRIIPQGRAGDFNQALMELGATVCLPNGKPLCDRCPLAHLCEGRKQGIPEEFPVKSQKAARKIEKRTVFVIISNGRVLLHQRENKGLLAGLWEFPNAEGWLTEQEAFVEMKRLGFTPSGICQIESAKHIFTHIEWHMWGYLVSANDIILPKKFSLASRNEVKSEHSIPSAFGAYTKLLNQWLEEPNESFTQCIGGEKMNEVYAPGCALMLYKPHLAEKVFAFLNKENGIAAQHLTCCHHQPGLEGGTTVINTCAGCDRRYRELYEGIDTISLWEVLAKSDTFPFPDYRGKAMAIHDACPVRSQSRVHDAVRTLLTKMNIKVIEPTNTRDKSVCCGDSFYGSLPVEEIKTQMKKRADEMPADDVVVYCVSCIKSMHIGGKKPQYLVDLLFGETTVPAPYEPDDWHGELKEFIKEH